MTHRSILGVGEQGPGSLFQFCHFSHSPGQRVPILRALLSCQSVLCCVPDLRIAPLRRSDLPLATTITLLTPHQHPIDTLSTPTVYATRQRIVPYSVLTSREGASRSTQLRLESSRNWRSPGSQRRRRRAPSSRRQVPSAEFDMSLVGPVTREEPSPLVRAVLTWPESPMPR